MVRTHKADIPLLEGPQHDFNKGLNFYPMYFHTLPQGRLKLQRVSLLFQNPKKSLAQVFKDSIKKKIINPLRWTELEAIAFSCERK